MIVLRLFHIVGGALWFGSAFLFAGFIGPAAAETAIVRPLTSTPWISPFSIPQAIVVSQVS